MTENDRRALRAANRAGAFTAYRKTVKPEAYADRTKARALLKHSAWIRYLVRFNTDDG